MYKLSLQTDKLPQIIVAEYATQRLKDQFKFKLGFRPARSRDELEEIFRKCEAALMTLKYSYISLEDLNDHKEVITIQRMAQELREAINPAIQSPSTHKLSYALLNWGVQLLEGFQNRLQMEGFELGVGIDVKVVRIRNIQKIGEFVKTRVSDDQREYTVMTNQTMIKSNLKLAVSFLPPTEVAGEISEAMFLGLKERIEVVRSILNSKEIDLREINAILFKLIKRK